MPIAPEQRANLQSLRLRLLDLHKLLLDRERGIYEAEHGALGSPGEYLGLVLSHAQFEWLRQMSGIIVEMDELLSPRTKTGPEDLAATLGAVRKLLVFDEEGNDYQRRYYQAIQDSPDIVIAHCKAEKLLGV